MKIKHFVSVLVVLSLINGVNGVAFAQTPTNPTLPTTNTQDPEKINNIKKLLEITDSRKLYQQMLTQLFDTMKSEFPQAPQGYWDKFLAELNPDDIINELIPIYSKYFTNEEIKGMIAFYQTPLGQKTITVLPQLTKDSTEVGIRYGREAAQRAIKKLEAEGYTPRRR